MGGHWEALAAALQQDARETGLSTGAGRGLAGQVIGLWPVRQSGELHTCSNWVAGSSWAYAGQHV